MVKMLQVLHFNGNKENLTNISVAQDVIGAVLQHRQQKINENLTLVYRNRNIMEALLQQSLCDSNRG